jgi:hypothetical protein
VVGCAADSGDLDRIIGHDGEHSASCLRAHHRVPVRKGLPAQRAAGAHRESRAPRLPRGPLASSLPFALASRPRARDGRGWTRIPGARGPARLSPRIGAKQPRPSEETVLPSALHALADLRNDRRSTGIRLFGLEGDLRLERSPHRLAKHAEELGIGQVRIRVGVRRMPTRVGCAQARRTLRPGNGIPSNGSGPQMVTAFPAMFSRSRRWSTEP